MNRYNHYEVSQASNETVLCFWKLKERKQEKGFRLIKSNMFTEAFLKLQRSMIKLCYINYR